MKINTLIAICLAVEVFLYFFVKNDWLTQTLAL